MWKELIILRKADEILKKRFTKITEKYDEGKLEEIEYKTNFRWVENNNLIFKLKTKRIVTNGYIDMEILQAINKKVKELRLDRRRRWIKR